MYIKTLELYFNIYLRVAYSRHLPHLNFLYQPQVLMPDKKYSSMQTLESLTLFVGPKHCLALEHVLISSTKSRTLRLKLIIDMLWDTPLLFLAHGYKIK